jgi:hypothetical protein
LDIALEIVSAIITAALCHGNDALTNLQKQGNSCHVAQQQQTHQQLGMQSFIASLSTNECHWASSTKSNAAGNLA